jgi:hypothetical protein
LKVAGALVVCHGILAVAETGPREWSWLDSTGEPRKQYEADSSGRQAALIEGSQYGRGA